MKQFLILISLLCLSEGLSAQEFITLWNTEATTEIKIPTFAYTYNYTVNWEQADNPSIKGTLNNQTGDVIITGLTPNTNYKVKIAGTFRYLYCLGLSSTEASKLREVQQWGSIKWSSMDNAFNGATKMDITATDVPNLTLCASMQNMFKDCSSLKGVGANWAWNTTNIVNMNSMFYNASQFNQDISTWNVGNVTNMYAMFYNASQFNQPIGSWNVSKVTKMGSMFESATAFNQPINAWNTSSVTDMGSVFALATAFNQPLDNWDMSNVTTTSSMFAGASNFNQNINTWNTSKLTTMSFMFYNAVAFNQPLGDWNVSNVTNTSSMFSGATAFNQPLNNWNVSNVTNMSSMFLGATAFNQPLNNWNVANVINMSGLFRNASSFNQALDAWDIGKVTTMAGMFQKANAFNQPLGNWNTSNVTTMESAFNDNTIFNQDLSNWNTAKVTTMNHMFYNASKFNQNLGTWDLSAVTTINFMLASSGLDCINYSNTLIGWAAATTTPSRAIIVYAQALKYTPSASAARATLMSKGWNFTGDALPTLTTTATNNCGNSLLRATTTSTAFSYLWSNGETTANITVTSPAIYSITVVDTKSCVLTSTASAAPRTVPTVYSINGLSAVCANGSIDITLSNSEVGVSYQFRKGPVTHVGSRKNGTGAPLTFNTTSTTKDVYWIQAIHNSSFCAINMANDLTVDVFASVNKYQVSGGGSSCNNVGLNVQLSGSDVGFSYQLKKGSTSVGSAINGTGSAISFGNQTAGTYTVVATRTIGGCTATMTGSAVVTINALPIVQTITGDGSYCTGSIGATLGLANSQNGVTYQLKNGANNVGTAVNGTGTAISFGNHIVAGIYTVVATNTTGGCTATMSGSLSVQGISCLTGVLSGNHTICKGNSAAISVATTSGVAPFTLVFSDGTTNTTITNYTSGASIVVTPSVATVYSLVSITDANGLQDSVSGTAVIAIDNTPAGFNNTTIPNDVTVTCDNIPTPATVSGINNCMTVTMNETSTKSTNATLCSFYSYKITRTWTATDKLGNTATAKQVITIGSTATPTILPLANITITEAEIPTTVPSANISFGNSCNVVANVSFTEVRTNQTPPPCLTYAYKLVRTWKVTDACGNNGTVSQTMLVRGIQLTCPSDKTVNTNSDGVNNYNCGTILNAALGLTPVYLDNCAVSTLKYELSGATSSFGSGSVAGIAFQKGITQVKYKLAHSGTDNCTFKVIVNDNELPRVTLNSTNTTVVLDNCSFDNVQFDTYKPIVSDNCTAMPTLSVLSDVSADISGCATKTADLKYTKKITRTWKATDDNGNTATALQTFYLRDKIAPTAECSTPIVSIGNTNLTYAASGLNNGSSDNCTSSSMLTFRACVGAGCTNYATNLTLRKTQISSPLTQTDLVVNVQVSDACGNTSVKTTKITLKKAGTLGNTKQSDTFNNEVSDNETNSPAEASAIPTVQGEMKCFPNPFNEDLNIQYNLTKPHENVTLKVYDNQGRLLKTMEQAEQLAGFYQIRWSLSDLKAGMYHICLELDGKCTKMERVILMK